jgi:hypothetical protein
MLYMEIMAYSFDNLTEHRTVMCGQNAELLVLNLVAQLDFKMSRNLFSSTNLKHIIIINYPNCNVIYWCYEPIV